MTVQPRFHGVFVALATPFTAQGVFDAPAYERLIEHVIAGGVNGIVPCGTTGEKSTLTIPEHKEVLEKAVECARGRVQVIAGTGSNDTVHAASMAAFAKSIGADAALSVTPYYNKPTQEGLFRHYSFIVENADFPIVIYNVPGRTAVNITPETIERLALADERIIGVKDAAASLPTTMRLVPLAARCPGFSILSGDDALTLPMIAVGAHGVISVAGNEIPDLMVQMVNAARHADMDTARDIHYRILNLMNLNFLETNPIPVKYALARMGLIEEAYRLPLCEMSAANKQTLDAALQELGLIARP